jgi:hypothetical protein
MLTERQTNGYWCENTFDAQNRLISRTSSHGLVTTYTYDVHGGRHIEMQRAVALVEPEAEACAP